MDELNALMDVLYFNEGKQIGVDIQFSVQIDDLYLDVANLGVDMTSK